MNLYVGEFQIPLQTEYQEARMKRDENDVWFVFSYFMDSFGIPDSPHVYNQYLCFTVMSPLGFAINGSFDTKERKSGNPKSSSEFGLERYSQFMLHSYASLMGSFSL